MSKQFTLQEVQQHNTPDNAYIIIDKSVYDVTKFAKLHPGGTNVLLEYAGKDATKVFNYFHTSKVLNNYHSKLLVGTLNQSEVKVDKKQKELEKPKNGFGQLVPYGDPNWHQGWNSPYYNESHIKYRNALREFASKEISPNISQWEENYDVPQQFKLKAGQAGVIAGNAGAPWNSKYYGDVIPGNIQAKDFDWFHYKILIEELNKPGSVGTYWNIGEGCAIGLPPILHYGSQEMNDRVSADVLQGKIKQIIILLYLLIGRKNICLCITEPWVGSDVAQLKTVAKKTPCGQFYIVNGLKKFITTGIYSDYFVVACRTGQEGMGGISLLLLEKSFPGIQAKRMKCAGLWASGTSYLTFEDVKVPKENLIGVEGQGFKYIMSNFNYERYGLCIQALTIARVCFEDSFIFAHKRHTFGKPIIEHQVIRNKLANMARQIESANAFIETVGYQLNNMNKEQQSQLLSGPIALLKVQCTTTLDYCAREAVQIFGGLGYTRGGQGERVELIYRSMKGIIVGGGSEEIMCDLGIRQAMKNLPPTAKL